ncbi:MAG: hypothetical protein PHV49_06580 [Alistipes sp.]|nr:hypothetical protein [Alistipes sp.]
MRLLGKYLSIVVVSVLLICVVSYLGVPVYRFDKGEPFAGDRIYNPYAGVDSSMWHKANFHAHQKEKPQCDYTVEQMLHSYYAQGYEVVGISDHQCLNWEHADRVGFIPTYEHGYGINGYHQLVLGTERVCWRDFPLMLTQSQMQYMLHYLRPEGEMVVLNHPGKTRWIDHAVYERLRGYDLLEINPDQGRSRSDTRWDRALTACIYSNLIADDDAHNIWNRGSWFQRCFTRINTPELTRPAILAALRQGKAYGVVIPYEVNIGANPHADLPSIRQIGLQGDTVHLRVDREAVLRFVGAEGRVLAEVTGEQAEYPMAATDPYVRVEACFPNGVMLYTNPFVRTADGVQPENRFVPVIDYPLTLLCHLLWLGWIVGLCWLLGRLLGMRRSHLYYRWHPRSGKSAEEKFP